MIYLLLSIVLNAFMSIAMRVGENKVKYKISMLAGNYLTCVVTGILWIGPGNIFPSAERMGYALGFGLMNGAFFMSALISVQYSISRAGIVLPSVFSRMGALLVPMGFSILMFGEKPGVMQIVGSILSVVGILMMTLQKGGEKSNRAPALLLMAVLFMEGLSCSMMKVYQETGNTMLSDQFLLYTFASACLLCVIVLILRKERPGLKELIFGILIGFPNYACTRFMLRALEQMPAIIVYPCRSVGAIALITLAGVFVFKEKLTRRQMAAMLVIVAAVALLNL